MRVVIFLLLAFSAGAQEVKSFFQLGVSSNAYKGDLSSAYQKFSSGVDIGFKTNQKKRLNLMFNLGIGNITGQNPNYSFASIDGLPTTPNKYFKTKYFNLNGNIHINLYKKNGLILYLSQGIGILRFNPLDENNNALSNNFSSREENEILSTTTISLPTNVGGIYTFKNGYGAGFQAGFLNPSTDYIDNISDWGTRSKKDNVLMYKFCFYVPIRLKPKEKPAVVNEPVVLALEFDTDKDGVKDSVDKCPTEVGIIENFGCPAISLDADKDGVLDSLDKCPDVVGGVDNDGCPKVEIIDKDSDGIVDEEDSCPDLPGVVENKGCPEVKKEDIVIIDKVKETLVFETGKANILAISYPALDAFAQQLTNNPDASILIEGHTDNIGAIEANQKLSADRAESVKNYLVNKGISETRINALGLGSARPIADNENEEGRALNRRVEIIILYNK